MTLYLWLFLLVCTTVLCTLVGYAALVASSKVPPATPDDEDEWTDPWEAREKCEDCGRHRMYCICE